MDAYYPSAPLFERFNMIDLMNLIKNINEQMAQSGFEQKLKVGNDNFEITESEVTIKMPFELTVKIPRESFEGDKETVSRAISQAISQTVSRNK